MARERLKAGDRCYVARIGEQETVGDLGVMAPLAVFESATDEPVQRLAANSDIEFLLKQWDEVLAPKPEISAWDGRGRRALVFNPMTGLVES